MTKSRTSLRTWTENELITELGDYREHALKADGFDQAIIGVGYRPGSDPILVYDLDKCINTLVKRDEMSPEDAKDFFEYNTLEAWVGEGTPIYVQLSPKWKEDEERGKEDGEHADHSPA